jgi:hypothetical protein
LKPTAYLIVTILICLALTPTTAAAQEDLSLEVRAGFDGFYKIDTWLPVKVTVANRGADLQGTLRLRDDNAGFGLSNVRYRYPVELPGQSRKQFTLYVPLRGQRRLVVELVDDQDTVLLSERANVSALGREEDVLIGVVAKDPSLLHRLSGLQSTNQRIGVAHLQPNDLPLHPRAWAGLDIVVFNDIDSAQLTPAQQDALSSWLRGGGRLVVGGGPNAAQTTAGLKHLLPFSGVTMHTLPHPLIGLQNFIRTPLADRGPYIAAVPTDFTGNVLAQQDQLPLIIAVRRGLGQVYYLALDLSLAPLDILASQPQFFPRLIGPLEARSHLVENFNAYTMRDSLALIPDQTLPSPYTVALYLIVYILAMGPVNYFVLRRMKRREWAWFSIPLIILVFSGFGYFSGFRLRGGRPLLRQITVIQADVGAPLSRIDSFIGIYSPYRADYDLKIEGRALVESLGSSGIGSELTVTTGDSTTVENLRSDIGGMPSIVAHSHAASPRITGNLRYNRASQRLSGTVINNTGHALANVLLVTDNQVLELGTLPSGQTQVDGTVSPRYAYDNFYTIDYPSQSDPRETMALASRDMTVRAMFNLDDYHADAPLKIPGLYLIGWQEDDSLGDGSIPVAMTNSRGDQISDTMLLIGLPFVAD